MINHKNTGPQIKVKRFDSKYGIAYFLISGFYYEKVALSLRFLAYPATSRSAIRGRLSSPYSSVISEVTE